MIAKHSATCVSMYDNKCKMQFMSNSFNILKCEWFNSCTHYDNWRDVKNSNLFQYKCGVLNCYMCFNKLW